MSLGLSLEDKQNYLSLIWFYLLVYKATRSRFVLRLAYGLAKGIIKNAYLHNLLYMVLLCYQ
jgi:hypothetical protein